MTIDVNTCDIQISQREFGLTRDRFTQSLLRQILEQNIQRSGWINRGSFPSPANIQILVDNFAEGLNEGAEANIQRYFSGLHPSGFTKGGRRVTSQALNYSQGRLIPSAQNIGAVGEGIAGYYLENIEGLQFEARPLGVSPDFIFLDLSRNRRVLVEIKTNLHQERTSLTDAIKLIDIMAKTKFIRSADYLGYIVYVAISGSDDFRLRVLRLEEV